MSSKREYRNIPVLTSQDKMGRGIKRYCQMLLEQKEWSFKALKCKTNKQKMW